MLTDCELVDLLAQHEASVEWINHESVDSLKICRVYLDDQILDLVPQFVGGLITGFQMDWKYQGNQSPRRVGYRQVKLTARGILDGESFGLLITQIVTLVRALTK